MTAKWAFGTQLQMSDMGGTPVWTTIAKAKSITPPQLETDTQDASDHQSPGGLEEVIPTIKRTGIMEIVLNWDPTAGTHNGTTGLIYVWDQKRLNDFRLIFNSSMGAGTWNISGYVIGFLPAALTFDGMAEATVRIKVSGAVTGW